ARLDVGDAVEGVRKRPPDLRQELELVHCETRLTAPGAGRRSDRADDIAEVEVDFAGAARVAEELNPAGAVDHVAAAELPHPAPGPHSPGSPALLVGLRPGLQPLGLGADGGDLIAVREARGEAHRRASLTGLPF